MHTINLDRAVFHTRSRIEVAAPILSAQRLLAKEGVHVVARIGEIDLTDADFHRKSIVAGDLSNAVLDTEPDMTSVPASPETQAQRRELREKANAAVAAITHTSVNSLVRANVDGLLLSAVNLEDCQFSGAHGLDKLRISETCTFRVREPRQLRKPSTWRYANRRLIYEEDIWRKARSATENPDKTPEPLAAAEIAGIYRELRKGLEDAKNEPGAADFYYGEMEMRRLSARKRHHRQLPPAPDLHRPSWVERWLLTAYWLVSGYGLRASRTVAAYAVVLLVCALLFMVPWFAYPTPPPERAAAMDPSTGEVRYERPGSADGALPPTACVEPPTDCGRATFTQALEFSARESLALLRNPGAQKLTTTGPGTVLDLALRLLGPILLGMAALAIRARTKR